MAQAQQRIRLQDMAATDALSIIATWLEDCEDHVAFRRPGDPPPPPFRFSEAWVVVRRASLYAQLPIADAT